MGNFGSWLGQVQLADFPAVFFHICHGTQQAVVTLYRAYQNVWAIISDRNELFDKYKYKISWVGQSTSVCGAFGLLTPSARWARIRSGPPKVRGLQPEYTLRNQGFVENLVTTHKHRGFEQPFGCLIDIYNNFGDKYKYEHKLRYCR